MYIFVRTDLTPSQIAVQSSHAAIEAANTFDLKTLEDHPYLVLLAVKNEAELHRVTKHLVEHGVRFVHFYENDLDGQLTAIASEPILGDRRRIFRKFQCLKNREVAEAAA